MPKTKAQKKEAVEKAVQEIKQAKSLVFANFSALNVEKDRELREKLKEKEITYQVFKKRLFQLALKKSKLEAEDFAQEKGNLSFCLSNDQEVEPAKIFKKFAQENKTFNILGGFLDGKYLTSAEVKSLADLPSQEELIVKLIYSIKSPLQNLANVLKQPSRNLIYVLNNIKK